MSYLYKNYLLLLKILKWMIVMATIKMHVYYTLEYIVWK